MVVGQTPYPWLFTYDPALVERLGSLNPILWILTQLALPSPASHSPAWAMNAPTVTKTEATGTSFRRALLTADDFPEAEARDNEFPLLPVHLC